MSRIGQVTSRSGSDIDLDLGCPECPESRSGGGGYTLVYNVPMYTYTRGETRGGEKFPPPQQKTPNPPTSLGDPDIYPWKIFPPSFQISYLYGLVGEFPPGPMANPIHLRSCRDTHA
jgi:hypothetical protein